MHPVLIILYCEGFAHVKHVVAPYRIVDLRVVSCYSRIAMSDAATSISCSLFRFLTSKIHMHACPYSRAPAPRPRAIRAMSRLLGQALHRMVHWRASTLGLHHR